MRAYLLIAAAAGLLLTGCGNNSSSTNKATNTVPQAASGNSANAGADYLGAAGQAQRYSINQIALAQVKQAIQQYNAAEGHYPKNLQELIPNYLAKIPAQPAGYQLSYDPATGQVKVVQQQ
jgi:hypothetical protein